METVSSHLKEAIKSLLHFQEDESAAQFASRVKTEIAREGGLVDLIWDGQLKRTSVKPEFKQQRQEDYASTLKIE